MAKHIRDSGMFAKVFFSFIFPMFFWVSGLLIVFVGVSEYFLAKESLQWPIAEGEIIHSEVVEHRRREDNRYRYTYKAEILFEYRVDGVDYEGYKIRFGDEGSTGSSSPQIAEEICAQYPVGEYVNVYYRPADPRESVLEVGVNGQVYFLPIFGLIFFLVGAAIAIFLPISAFRKPKD